MPTPPIPNVYNGHKKASSIDIVAKACAKEAMFDTAKELFEF